MTDHDRMLARFHAYAATFEAAYASDDWSLLEPYFTEGATTELNGNLVAGRAAVLASLRDGVEMFDRRFDTRALHITHGPTVEDGRLHVTIAARYARAGLPPIELVGEEWFTFEGDRIARHVDQVVNIAEVMSYLAQHSDGLRPMRSAAA